MHGGTHIQGKKLQMREGMLRKLALRHPLHFGREIFLCWKIRTSVPLGGICLTEQAIQLTSTVRDVVHP